MSNKQYPSLKHLILKHLLIVLVTTLVGAGIAIQQVYAETKSVNVPGVGWVGTAKTVGFPSSGSTGTSTSTTPLYYIRAHLKIWHVGPLLYSQDNKVWYWSKGGNTNTLTSTGYGDYGVTLHRFQLQLAGSSATAYTSDNGVRSCSNAWSTFVYNC